jgi:hypothetical protein
VERSVTLGANNVSASPAGASEPRRILMVSVPHMTSMTAAVFVTVSEVHNKIRGVILSERGPERLSVRGW